MAIWSAILLPMLTMKTLIELKSRQDRFASQRCDWFSNIYMFLCKISNFGLREMQYTDYNCPSCSTLHSYMSSVGNTTEENGQETIAIPASPPNSCFPGRLVMDDLGYGHRSHLSNFSIVQNVHNRQGHRSWLFNLSLSALTLIKFTATMPLNLIPLICLCKRKSESSEWHSSFGMIFSRFSAPPLMTLRFDLVHGVVERSQLQTSQPAKHLCSKTKESCEKPISRSPYYMFTYLVLTIRIWITIMHQDTNC